jgi:DNA invertase Pin-like site-specific DNA recombinase
MKRYIAYYRVSTTKQEDSGLGLEAQKSAVERFMQYEENRSYKLNNGNIERCALIAEFQEIESGRNDSRPKIHEAIRMCRQIMNKGDEVILLIAKLDRLSRSVHFISTLQNSKIKFVCCDMPDANDLTIGLMAVIAQNEAKLTSERTKSALIEKNKNNPDGFINKKGVYQKCVGNPENFNNEGRIKGGESMKKIAEENPINIMNMNYATMLRSIEMTYEQIANKMNLDGFRTLNGANFTAMQVKRLLDRKKNQIVTE